MAMKGNQMPSDSPKVIGYLRVSTQDQDLEKNKADILPLPMSAGSARSIGWRKKFPGPKAWRTRELGQVVASLRQR